MTSITVIRHGETDWNVEGRYQGQADPPLNERGFDQAHELADMLMDNSLDMIYSSPLQRALQTAQIIADHLHLPLHTDARLLEINQGDWQTRLRSEIEDLYPELFRRWEKEPWEVTPPSGEHLTEVQSRVYAAIDDIVVLHPTHHIGLVTHRIPIALIKIRYQSLDPDVIRTMHLPNIYTEEIHIGA
jgi:broad specificity phosphatase PhoE